jgi:hypothetical protein
MIKWEKWTIKCKNYRLVIRDRKIPICYIIHDDLPFDSDYSVDYFIFTV